MERQRPPNQPKPRQCQRCGVEERLCKFCSVVGWDEMRDKKEGPMYRQELLSQLKEQSRVSQLREQLKSARVEAQRAEKRLSHTRRHLDAVEKHMKVGKHEKKNAVITPMRAGQRASSSGRTSAQASTDIRDAGTTIYNHLYKYIIIGDVGVGKSCLLLQFMDKRFRAERDMTIGVQFGHRVLQIEKQKIKLQVWDAVGHEAFTKSYYHGAVGALLVYDISRRASFDHLTQWLMDTREHAQPNIVISLVGNKTDLEDRSVSYEEGAGFARHYGLTFVETSAKTGDNVDAAFVGTARQIFEDFQASICDLSLDPCGIQHDDNGSMPARQQYCNRCRAVLLTTTSIRPDLRFCELCSNALIAEFDSLQNQIGKLLLKRARLRHEVEQQEMSEKCLTNEANALKAQIAFEEGGTDEEQRRILLRLLSQLQSVQHGSDLRNDSVEDQIELLSEREYEAEAYLNEADEQLAQAKSENEAAIAQLEQQNARVADLTGDK